MKLAGRQLTIVALLLALAGSVATVSAGNGPDSADVQVWAIRATTNNKDISPELRPIADALKKQFKYTGFKLEKKARGATKIGRTFATPLVGGYSAEVTPQAHDGKHVTLRVQLLKGKKRKLGVTVKLAVRKFHLSGGLSLDGGDALIVAVSAR